MKSLLMAVDKASTLLGQAFAWLIVLLTGLIAWEVFSRYVLNSPHDWTLDAQIMMYGTLFMLAGAYTLAKNGHVRGDVLYGFFEPRTQAWIDLVLYILFFLPGIVALTWAGWTYANEALAIREKTFSATPLPLYPFKFVIPFAGGLLLFLIAVDMLFEKRGEGAKPKAGSKSSQVRLNSVMPGLACAAGATRLAPWPERPPRSPVQRPPAPRSPAVPASPDQKTNAPTPPAGCSAQRRRG